MHADKWTDELLSGLKEKKSVSPDPALLPGLIKRIYGTEQRIIPLRQLRLLAAAASLLFFINVLAFWPEQQQNYSALATEKAAGELILTDFNLYE